MGNDDEAYREALVFACELARTNAEIKRIIVLVNTKNNTGWFERLFGDEVVKKMYSGFKFNECSVPVKIETMNTFRDLGQMCVVIASGLDSKSLFKIDHFFCAESIIAIPWLRENLGEWAGTWGPQDIRAGVAAQIFDLPTCIVQRAMTDLTQSINMSTGITHTADGNLAKTFILALHQYEGGLNANMVSGYLIRSLGWRTDAAQDVAKLINTLNDGRHFQGVIGLACKGIFSDGKRNAKLVTNRTQGIFSPFT